MPRRVNSSASLIAEPETHTRRRRLKFKLRISESLQDAFFSALPMSVFIFGILILVCAAMAGMVLGAWICYTLWTAVSPWLLTVFIPIYGFILTVLVMWVGTWFIDKMDRYI